MEHLNIKLEIKTRNQFYNSNFLKCDFWMQNLKGGIAWAKITIDTYTNITNVRNEVSETTDLILII